MKTSEQAIPEVRQMIKSLLANYQYSQAKFAKAFGIPESAVSRYMTGQSTPRGELYLKIYLKYKEIA